MNIRQQKTGYCGTDSSSVSLALGRMELRGFSCTDWVLMALYLKILPNYHTFSHQQVPKHFSKILSIIIPTSKIEEQTSERLTGRLVIKLEVEQNHLQSTTTALLTILTIYQVLQLLDISTFTVTIFSKRIKV